MGWQKPFVRISLKASLVKLTGQAMQHKGYSGSAGPADAGSPTVTRAVAKSTTRWTLRNRARRRRNGSRPSRDWKSVCWRPWMTCSTRPWVNLETYREPRRACQRRRRCAARCDARAESSEAVGQAPPSGQRQRVNAKARRMARGPTNCFTHVWWTKAAQWSLPRWRGQDALFVIP